jgi:hypothetical protein
MVGWSAALGSSRRWVPSASSPASPAHQGSRSWFLEVGLYWAIDPVHQEQGYATEAARALIIRGVAQFQLGRFVATTETSNARSQAVMRKLGMDILRNPEPEPTWFQTVGVLEASLRADESRAAIA